jgi:drug/metabolite transporter (DMT)-like permease
VLLTQLFIPLTLLLSALLLRTRYKRHEVAGAVVIIAGVLVAIVPTLLPKHAHHTAAHDTHAASSSPPSSPSTKWYSVVIFAASTIPQVG